MKNFKIAEIVPVSSLKLTKDNQYHMCLAHLVLQNEDYANFYRRMSDEGKYVLMDNGAAENSQLNDEDLIKAYEMINPTEIVLPDTICNCDDTVRKSVEFVNKMGSRISKYKWMVVPQGKDLSQWINCFTLLKESLPFINSVGVSKFLEMESGQSKIRFEAVKYLIDFDVEIHLLGCSEGPSIVHSCRSINSKVRGCDSAFVYIASKSGLSKIDQSTTRPEGFIDFLNDSFIDSTERLMSEFESVCGVVSNKEDASWR